MRVGIIGCGNIGQKRARIVQEAPQDQLVALAESDPRKHSALHAAFALPIDSDPQPLIDNPDIDALVIATPPANHIALIQAALAAGKDVLCEKPLGEHTAEVRAVTEDAARRGKILKCGFNLRHDVGLNYAHEALRQGAIGELYYCTVRYVNGCVRVNTNQVGALKDMGSHALDLVHWFCGRPTHYAGFLQRTEYALPRDDNGMLTFTTAHNVIGQIHFSFVRWQNAFHLEIGGSSGTIEVDNLTKWGQQRVRVHTRVLPSGRPTITEQRFEGDLTWAREWECFQHLCAQRNFDYNTHALAVSEATDTILAQLELRDFTKELI